MPTEKREAPAEKATYIQQAEQNLAEMEARLETVKAKALSKIASGHLGSAKRLRKLVHDADRTIALAQARVVRLKELENIPAEQEDMWHEVYRSMEETWDEVSQSISKLMARFD